MLLVIILGENMSEKGDNASKDRLMNEGYQNREPQTMNVRRAGTIRQPLLGGIQFPCHELDALAYTNKMLIWRVSSQRPL